MIRVLHVVGSMDRGGIETFLMNVYRNINRNEIQFDFLTHSEGNHAFDDEIRKLGGRIYTIPNRSKGIFKNKKSLDNFFKKHTEYQIVHEHSSSLSYIEPLKYAQKYGVPVRIIHSHSSRQSGKKINKYFHYLNRTKISNIATDFFAASDEAAKWLFDKEMFNTKNYHIIKNGIDTRNFLYNEQIREEVRQELNLSENQIVIGHVGRLTYAKNHLFLLELFRKYQEINPNSRLLLVGDGELKDYISNLVQELGLEKFVILTGSTSNVSSLLQAMDIFIFPSHFEGLGISLIEAQSTGLPCIASTNVPSEVRVTDNISFLNLDSNFEIWIEEINSMLNNNRRKSRNFEVINSGFDIKNVAKNLSVFYANSINN
ncbi:glycosyltransferase family 1 protein [Aerococcus viridans]|uniref:glycosyltransferase family 1 protein n=1 Tax=Aerococcus viridans TaxID=1377 RepID=UPI003B21228E